MKMTSQVIKAAVAKYYRYTRQCRMVAFESNTIVVLTDRLIKIAGDWHAANFPKCHASMKHNKMCNHYKCFLDGYRCCQWLSIDEQEDHERAD